MHSGRRGGEGEREEEEQEVGALTGVFLLVHSWP